ncbi:MAG: hypothetical protein JO301_05310 [Chitinophagaceae bacterium]|nr:hypothetical protein [Chitinophagaceae bacterium]
MKKKFSFSFALILLTAIPQFLHAQGMVGSEGVRLLEFRDVDGTLFKSGAELGIRGTPMVEEGWARGTVHFRNGLVFTDSAINMSLYNGRLYVRRNNRYIELVQQAASLSLSFQHEDNSSASYEFKSGFPAVDELTENTIYQVLYEGHNLQLLSFERKKVVDPNTYGGPTQKEYTTIRQLFLFQPADRKMVRLKSFSAEALRNALPFYNAGITNYLGSGKKSPRNKEQFLEMLAFLDK